jgi:hypothetical protein
VRQSTGLAGTVEILPPEASFRGRK